VLETRNIVLYPQWRLRVSALVAADLMAPSV